MQPSAAWAGENDLGKQVAKRPAKKEMLPREESDKRQLCSQVHNGCGKSPEETLPSFSRCKGVGRELVQVALDV